MKSISEPDDGIKRKKERTRTVCSLQSSRSCRLASKDYQGRRRSIHSSQALGKQACAEKSLHFVPLYRFVTFPKHAFLHSNIISQTSPRTLFVPVRAPVLRDESLNESQSSQKGVHRSKSRGHVPCSSSHAGLCNSDW